MTCYNIYLKHMWKMEQRMPRTEMKKTRLTNTAKNQSDS